MPRTELTEEQEDLKRCQRRNYTSTAPEAYNEADDRRISWINYAVEGERSRVWRNVHIPYF